MFSAPSRSRITSATTSVLSLCRKCVQLSTGSDSKVIGNPGREMIGTFAQPFSSRKSSIALSYCHLKRIERNFSSNGNEEGSHITGGSVKKDSATLQSPEHKSLVRLSKLVSQYSANTTMSRREAERIIRGGSITLSGKVVIDPRLLVSFSDASGQIKLEGKQLILRDDNDFHNDISGKNTTKVWVVHKLNGEVVAELDPLDNKKSMMDRLVKGGVGQRKGRSPWHLKPIGRLDMATAGLILVTNNGSYARDMELPSNKLHRTYRVRVHGIITPHKLKAIRVGGVTKGDMKYPPMKIELESLRKNKRSSTNIWMRITCTEGKNRQVRNVLHALGLTVTRLIRISFGDYQLHNIPPGMAIEVDTKAIDKQKLKGRLITRSSQHKHQGKRQARTESMAPPVEWIRH